jgi:hypothetical protein
LVLATWPSTKFSAVRTGGVGDVTETNVAWTVDQDVPDVTSPVSDGNLVWTLSTMGVLDSYGVATGRRVESNELQMSFQASPSLAGGKLYLLTAQGTMLILEASPQPREVGRCELGEEVFASPAFAGGRIYIRGVKHLYCIDGVKRQAP